MMAEIVAKVTDAGIEWEVRLVPLESIRVTANGKPVDVVWDRQTLCGPRSRPIPHALSVALRVAINDAEGR